MNNLKKKNIQQTPKKEIFKFGVKTRILVASTRIRWSQLKRAATTTESFFKVLFCWTLNEKIYISLFAFFP